MTQEEVDSGTLIFDQNGEEIGVIKKIYSENLARLELQNSETIAMDPTLVKDITVTGRILKKRSATILPEAKVFFDGAQQILNEITFKAIVLLIDQLVKNDIQAALQQFEFKFLDEVELGALPNLKALGLVRGIQLAGKTPQDFIVKRVFQASERDPQFQEKMAPEEVVDKLNREKAFVRILWNLQRIAVAQAIKLKDTEMIDACIDTIFELGLKQINIELKKENSKDILHWQKRFEGCVLEYLGLMLSYYEPSIAATDEEGEEELAVSDYFTQKKQELQDQINEMNLNSILKEETSKALEEFDLHTYVNSKPLELLHGGVQGFNLKVMMEKKSMKQLREMVDDFFANDYPDGGNIVNLRKNIDEFTKDLRDVSKDFLNLLLEIGQYLKKMEYGDSTVQNYYSALLKKTDNKKYSDIHYVLSQINQKFENSS
ncbi:MAG: hypothetical protein GF308_02680 [Candidatus Heimdallarchaeota archaeon]|nr:hypothetical protein [Candidatus Heimdallarchaeota archaeon]